MTESGCRSHWSIFFGKMQVSFNRHGAAPLVWSIRCVTATGAHVELNVNSIVFKVDRVSTVYAPKATPDDEDGMSSAYLTTEGELRVYEDGHAEITNGGA